MKVYYFSWYIHPTTVKAFLNLISLFCAMCCLLCSSVRYSTVHTSLWDPGGSQYIWQAVVCHLLLPNIAINSQPSNWTHLLGYRQLDNPLWSAVYTGGQIWPKGCTGAGLVQTSVLYTCWYSRLYSKLASTLKGVA
jgi:hypothetical protein